MTTYIFRLGTSAGRMSEKHLFLSVSPWLIRTDPALRAGPAKLALSQAFRQNPSLAAAGPLPGGSPRPTRLGFWRISGLMISLKTIFNGAQRRYDVGNIETEFLRGSP